MNLEFKYLNSLNYGEIEIKRGATDRVLSVDLSKNEPSIYPVPPEIKEIFSGGKGYCFWALWNSVSKDTKWDDPENALCIASGSLSGTAYPGSGKSIVTTISPLTGVPIDSNVGGHFGPYLKFAGFDMLEIRGKSESGNAIILIDAVWNKVVLLEPYFVLPENAYELATFLTERFGSLPNYRTSVVCTGPGAKHALMGCLNFSWYDQHRKRVRFKQAGRGGTGTVFADKGVKAIVVRCDASQIGAGRNNPADPKGLLEAARRHNDEIKEEDSKQNQMAIVGTTHLTSIMGAEELNLLPVKNFQFGSHPEVEKLSGEVFGEMFDKGFDGCWRGCTLSCAHGIKNFVPETGPDAGKEVFVDGPEYETVAGCGSNLGIFDPHTVAEINYYCDVYGIDTISFGNSVGFVMECFERGLISSAHIGGMDLSFGNKESVLRLVHQMAEGKGFGRIVGHGVRIMKTRLFQAFGADPKLMNDIGMESKGLEFSFYITKESLAQQGGYGLACKGSQHDEAWLIFEDMVRKNLPTFEDKAEALWWFPLWRTWFSLMGLCKLPWNDVVPPDNVENPQQPLTAANARAKIPKHVQWFADYYNTMTGKNLTPDDLILMSERVYTFQRIFNLRMGKGTREHDGIPYRAMGPVLPEEYEARKEYYDKILVENHSIDIAPKTMEEKIAILRKFREEAYEQLKDAVYKRRGWTNDGIPTIETVKRLGIDFREVMELLQ